MQSHPAGLTTLLDSNDQLSQTEAKCYAWGIRHRRGRGHMIALLRRATARGVRVRHVPISYVQHRDGGGAATIGDIQITERNKVACETRTRRYGVSKQGTLPPPFFSPPTGLSLWNAPPLVEASDICS